VEGALARGPSVGTRVEDIDVGFVPRPGESVTACELGLESLLVDEEAGTFHVLNAVGSALWACFDGETELGVHAEMLAEAFGAPKDVVERDVLDLTKVLAGEGLLAGIARRDWEGVEAGVELTPFRLPDLDGVDLDLAELRGRQVLLVNWSPSCGFCDTVAAELAELQPALEARTTELVLLSAGDEGAHRSLREEHGLKARIVLRRGGGGTFADPFTGEMGTPVAYLLDERGRTAAPLAQGAWEVTGLARRVAGLDGTPQYVRPEFGRMSSPRRGRAQTPDSWQPTVAYRVGEHLVGVRSDTAAAGELVGRFLASHRVGEDEQAPACYSVLLGDRPGRASGALKRLLQAETTVVRSRSSRRVLLGLAAYLAGHASRPRDGLVRTRDVAVVGGGQALVLPLEVSDLLEQLTPRLARLGLVVVDEPYVSLDLRGAELVVSEPSLDLDPSVLDEVAEPSGRFAEPPRVEPGRYGIRGWFASDDERGQTRAGLVSATLEGAVGVEPKELAATVEDLDRLFDRIEVVPLPLGGPGEVADFLAQRLASG
jgi:hypothetical protein